MRRWRLPLLLSSAVLAGQVLHRPALVEVTSNSYSSSVALEYPLAHVILAPLTLAADWLNGGSRPDLYGFLAWALAAAAVLVFAGPFRPRAGRSTILAIALRVVCCLVLPTAFVAFVVWAPRPIPRLVAPAGAVVFDVHTHTDRSHDGRPGFTAAANAAWHQRAGFHAAFVTDHNTNGAAAEWRRTAPPGPPRLLDGIELSLYGLHLLVLGTADSLDNRAWNQSWDSTLALINNLRPRRPADPLLIASLPEFWRHQWGQRMGQLAEAGLGGFEVWTSSPKAMEFPPAARQMLLAHAASGGLALAGATDMHGIGRTATVWNVATIGGWESLSDSALSAALIGALRMRLNHVYAIDRWQARHGLDHIIAVPLNGALVLRTASPLHGLALLLWIWVPALLLSRRRGAAAP